MVRRTDEGRGRKVTRVIGVDAAGPKHWVGVSSDLRAYAAETVAALVADADRDGFLDVIAVDIPIGLPVAGERRADLLARAAVGPRRQSVFATPVRAALLAPTHADAVAVSRTATGKGISRQAWALGKRILEVDAFVRRAERTVIEVHPEVSFALLAGRHLSTRKSKWSGIEERRRLLAGAGLLPTGDLGVAGQVAGVDDVLDAAVACWSARRYADGTAVAHPAEPELFEDGGIAAAIWA